MVVPLGVSPAELAVGLFVNRHRIEARRRLAFVQDVAAGQHGLPPGDEIDLRAAAGEDRSTVSLEVRERVIAQQVEAMARRLERGDVL